MDFYSDDSDPNLDADLQEDLDALCRSCILSGADPAAASSSSYLTGPSTPHPSAPYFIVCRPNCFLHRHVGSWEDFTSSPSSSLSQGSHLDVAAAESSFLSNFGSVS